MKTISILILTVTLAASAFAGTAVTYSGKGKVPVQPMPPAGCDCFAPGFALGGFGGGYIPREGEGGFGGGALAEYFFTENLGIQVAYGAFNATETTLHNYGGDLVLRLPIKSICIAPYIMAGGGGVVDGENHGYWDAGAGLDVRFPSLHCMSIFADGAYHWTKSTANSATVVRLGVKFPL